MKWWPWSRRCPQPTEDARHAVEQAQRQLRDVDRRSQRVDEVAEQLHEIRRRNHFGEAVRQSFGGV